MRYDPKDYCRHELTQISPYQPGKSAAELEREYQVADAIKLASNENLLGPSPLAIQALRDCADKINFYPDGAGTVLRQRLAERYQLAAECITLGNGSNELLELVGRCFLKPGDEAVYSEHAFAVYELTTRICGACSQVASPYPAAEAMPYGHDLEAMRLCLTDKARVVFIANPNNPTGTWLEEDALKHFLDRTPRSCIVVIDQAYAEYADDSMDLAAFLKAYPNLVITRTFSKAFGLAGLRIGYALSSADIAALLNRIRQPFNVNMPALEAASAALEDIAHIRRSIEVNQAGLAQLRQGCAELGLAILPSRANFVCVEVGDNAALVYTELLRKGMIVRPISNYNLPRHLRVTVGLPEHNQSFLNALAEVMQNLGGQAH